MATITDKAYDPAGTGNFVGGTPVITADSLSKPQKQVQLPPPVAPTPPSTFINNLQPAIQQSNQGLIQAQTEEAAQRNDVLKNLLRVDDPNSQGTYDSKFRQLGGNDYLKQFTDANTRLAQLQGVFNQASQKVSSAPGQSQVFEGLQLNEVSRQKAAEVGYQALVVQAMQGNIETARQIALDTTRFASEDRAAKLQSLMAQFQSLDGIVQGQEKQLIDAQKVKVEQELKQLERAQTYIDSAISSGDASVEEMKQLTRTDLSDFEKQNIAAQIINRSAGAKTAFDRKVQLAGLKQLSTDPVTGNQVVYNPYNDSYSAVNVDSINSQYSDGSVGGQCGTFTKNLTTLPTPNGRTGHLWAEKKSFVDKYGINLSQVQGGDVQAGDVLYFDTTIGSEYGHVATVINNNGDGTVTVKDSNWNGDQKVMTHDIALNHPSLYGSIRGTLKEQYTTPSTKQYGPAMPGQYDTSKFTQQFYSTPAGQKALNNEQQYYQQFNNNQVVKDYQVIATKVDSVNKIIESGVGGPGDLSVVYEFMKALDPNSVVRETEFATAAKSGNLFLGQLAKFNGYFKDSGGFLPENVKQAFSSIVNSKLEAQTTRYNALANQTRKIAYDQGLNPDHVAPLVDTFTSSKPVSPEAAFAEQILSGNSPIPQGADNNFAPANNSTYVNPINVIPFGGLAKPLVDSYSYIKSLFGR